MRLGSSARHTIWIFCFFVNFSKKSKNIVIENVSSFVSWDISFIWFQLVVLLFSQTITRLSIAVKICQKWSDDIINRRARWWLWWFPFVSQIWQVVYAQIRERERESKPGTMPIDEHASAASQRVLRINWDETQSRLQAHEIVQTFIELCARVTEKCEYIS